MVSARDLRGMPEGSGCMRPRKRVLLFCADETRACLLSFRLELQHPLRVRVATTLEGLSTVLLERGSWDGMVHLVTPGAPNEAAAVLLANAGGDAIRMEVWPMRNLCVLAEWSTAHRVIWMDDPGAIGGVVFQAMRRKRGPKKSGSRRDRTAHPAVCIAQA